MPIVETYRAGGASLGKKRGERAEERYQGASEASWTSSLSKQGGGAGQGGRDASCCSV